MPSRDEILKALEAVIDPELRRSIVELEMVRSIDAADGLVRVTVSLTTPGCPIRSHFETAVRQAVGALDGVERELRATRKDVSAQADLVTARVENLVQTGITRGTQVATKVQGRVGTVA